MVELRHPDVAGGGVVRVDELGVCVPGGPGESRRDAAKTWLLHRIQSASRAGRFGATRTGSERQAPPPCCGAAACGPGTVSSTSVNRPSLSLTTCTRASRRGTASSQHIEDVLPNRRCSAATHGPETPLTAPLSPHARVLPNRPREARACTPRRDPASASSSSSPRELPQPPDRALTESRAQAASSSESGSLILPSGTGQTGPGRVTARRSPRAGRRDRHGRSVTVGL